MMCTSSSYGAEQCSVNFFRVPGVTTAREPRRVQPSRPLPRWHSGEGALPSRVPNPAVFTGARSPAPFHRPTQQEQHRRRRPYPKQKRAMARAAECRINRKIWVALHMSWGGRGLKSEKSGGKRLATCTHARSTRVHRHWLLCSVYTAGTQAGSSVGSQEEGVGGGNPLCDD